MDGGSWAETNGVQVGYAMVSINDTLLLGLPSSDFSRLMKTRPLHIIFETKPQACPTGAADSPQITNLTNLKLQSIKDSQVTNKRSMLREHQTLNL